MIARLITAAPALTLAAVMAAASIWAVAHSLRGIRARTEANTYFPPNGCSPRCRICNRAEARRSKARRRVRRSAQ